MQEIESFNNTSSIKFCNSDEIKCTKQGRPWLREHSNDFLWEQILFLVNLCVVSLPNFNEVHSDAFIRVKRMKPEHWQWWLGSDPDPELDIRAAPWPLAWCHRPCCSWSWSSISPPSSWPRTRWVYKCTAVSFLWNYRYISICFMDSRV